MLEEIDRRLREEPAFEASRCIVIEGEGWHRGIIGILASRVVDRMRRPAIVIALEGGEAYGSGRSVPGFHLLKRSKVARNSSPALAATPTPSAFRLACGSRAGAEEPPRGLGRRSTWKMRRPVCVATRSYPSIKSPRPCSAGCAAWSRWATAMRSRSSSLTTCASRLRYAPSRIVTYACSWPRGLAAPVGLPWGGIGQRASRRLGLEQGSVIHLAYKLRQNQHPEYGGLELEIADLAPAG